MEALSPLQGMYMRRRLPRGADPGVEPYALSWGSLGVGGRAFPEAHRWQERGSLDRLWAWLGLERRDKERVPIPGAGMLHEN